MSRLFVIVVETFRRTTIVVGPAFVNVTVELEREALIPVELKLTAAARVMVPRNPLTAVTVRLEEPFAPRTSVRLVGFRDSVKSLEGDAWDGLEACVEGWKIARGPSTAVISRRTIIPRDILDDRK